MRYGWQALFDRTGSPQKGCLVNFTRSAFLAGSAMLFAVAAANPAGAQDLQDRQALTFAELVAAHTVHR